MSNKPNGLVLLMFDVVCVLNRIIQRQTLNDDYPNCCVRIWTFNSKEPCREHPQGHIKRMSP